MGQFYEIAIVGASVAGASAAIRLAQAGVAVILFDQANFPRTKACGEGLSSHALPYLEELGVLEQVQAAAHAPFYGYTIWRRGSAFRLGFSPRTEVQARGIGIERNILDALLIAQTQEHSQITLRLGARVTHVERENAGFVVHTAKERISCRFLILADGVNSALASRLNIPVLKKRPGVFGSRIILEGEYTKPADSIAVILGQESEIYCTPLGPSRLNVSVLGPKQAAAGFGRAESLEKLGREVEAVAGFCAKSLAAPPIGAAFLGSIRRKGFHQGVLLAGDVCESIDPIGGMGMTHALMSSRCAVECLLNVLSGQQPEERAFERYEAQRAREAAPLRGLTNLTELVLRRLDSGGVLNLLSISGLPTLLREALEAEADKASAGLRFFRGLLRIAGV